MNRNKRYKLIAICFMMVQMGFVWGQQLRMPSLYFLSPYTINPAYAGMEETLSFTGMYRKQWAGIRGAPEGQAGNVHLPIYYLGGATGISFEKEVIGAQEETTLSFSYSQRIATGRSSMLALSLGGGWRQRTLDGSKLRAPDGSYPEGSIFSHNDALLPETMVRGQAPTLQAGIYFRHPVFEVGVAVYNLAESTLDYGFSEAGDYVFRRHYTVTGRGMFPVGDNLTLRPAVLFMTDAVEQQVQVSVEAGFRDLLIAGVGLRGYDSNTLDAAICFAGLRVNEQFSLAYAFDYTLSGLQQLTDGSHELMVRYQFGKPLGKGRLPKIIYNPRFL